MASWLMLVAKITHPFMKGVIDMILFIILAVTLIVLIGIIVLTVAIGGSATIIMFGDVIVCIAILIWIINRLLKKRNNK